MPGPLANLVLERANAPGTAATITVSGAPSGWIGLVAAVGNGGTAYYFMSDGVQTEWGHGTIAAGSLNSITRGVIGNSAGTTQRLNFTGAVDVWCALPAERTPFFDAANAALPMAGRRLTGLGAASAQDDAPRFDQVGWRVVGNVLFTAPQVAVIFSLPALIRFRLEWEDLTCATPAPLYARYSYDGGTTFVGDATGYASVGVVARPSGLGGLASPGNIIALTPPDHGGPTFGGFEFQPFSQHPGIGQVWGRTTDAQPYYVGMSAWSGIGGTATHVLLGFVNADCAAGRVRLLGAHI